MTLGLRTAFKLYTTARLVQQHSRWSLVLVNGRIDLIQMFLTQPGHPSMGGRNEYQQKLGRKQEHRTMHNAHICDLAV